MEQTVLHYKKAIKLNLIAFDWIKVKKRINLFSETFQNCQIVDFYEERGAESYWYTSSTEFE